MSCLTVPVFEIPEGAVPTAQCRPELSRNCRHLRATYNRNDHAGFDHHIVHGNEQCRSLDGIKLAFGRVKEVIILFVMPAGGQKCTVCIVENPSDGAPCYAICSQRIEDQAAYQKAYGR